MRQALLGLVLASLASGAGPRPKVRAVTAFIDIDRKNYTADIERAVKFLNGAREAYRGAGFEVETIRLTTQPFPRYVQGLSRTDALALVRQIEQLSARHQFALNIGPATIGGEDGTAAVDLLTEILCTSKLVRASMIVGDESGVHWKAVGQAAALVKTVSERTPRSQGAFSFAATAMLRPYGPFYPGAYHPGGPPTFAVAIEGANVVAGVFARQRDPEEAVKQLSAALAAPLREAEQAALGIAERTGWKYAGIDPTPAPLKDVSIGGAIESFIGGPFGASGTMTAAAVITRAVQSVPVKRTGYAGLMVPILEDSVLARRWAEGTYGIDSLLAYSAVCGTGLDTIPLPGDTSRERLARIIGDMATLAYKWNKPLSARLLPVAGKKPGQRTEFDDPFLVNTVIQPLIPAK